jgi:hypothetical protein
MVLAPQIDLPTSLWKVDPRVMDLSKVGLVLLFLNLMIRNDLRIFPDKIASWCYLVVRVHLPLVGLIMLVVFKDEGELPSAPLEEVSLRE